MLPVDPTILVLSHDAAVRRLNEAVARVRELRAQSYRDFGSAIDIRPAAEATRRLVLLREQFLAALEELAIEVTVLASFHPAAWRDSEAGRFQSAHDPAMSRVPVDVIFDIMDADWREQKAAMAPGARRK